MTNIRPTEHNHDTLESKFQVLMRRLDLDDNEEEDQFTTSSSTSTFQITSWDLKSLKKSQHYLLKALLIICHGGFLSGYALGMISGILIDIEMNFQVNALEIGLIVATLPLGTFLGCSFTMHLVKKRGFLQVLFLQNIYLTTGSMLIASAHSLKAFALGRLIVGLGLSFSSYLNHSYLTALSPPVLKETTLSCYHLSIACGIFISCLFCRLFHTSEGISWGLLYSIQVLLGGIHALLLLLLPESPQWLAQQPHQEQKSREILFQLFETQTEVDETFNSFCGDQDEGCEALAENDTESVAHEVDIQPNTQRSFICCCRPYSQSWKLLVKYRLGVLYILILLFIQFSTGSYILRSYSSYLFLQIGFTPTNALNCTVVLALCHVLTIAWFLHQVPLSLSLVLTLSLAQ
jgi:hypothetical protein